VAALARHPPTAAVLAWMLGAVLAAYGGLWSGMGATALLVGAGVLAAERRSLLATMRPSLAQALVGLVAGLSMTLATHALYRLVGPWVPFVTAGTAELYREVGTSRHVVFALLLVPIAVAEEVVWRGAVQTALAGRFTPPRAVALGAVLYTAAHVPIGAPVLLLAALGCGLVWGGLRAATGSLFAPIVAHVLWDEVLLFVAPLIRR
jgi:membrane protease YdiL (CAAX protease family)